MNFSSNTIGDQSSDDESTNSTRKINIDADIHELENMFNFKKLPPSSHELRVFSAAAEILKDSIAIIPMLFLSSELKLQAANQLVEECLLISLEDLFKDEDYLDPEGYLKNVPDNIDLLFAGSLARYNITVESYLKSIIIPDIWRTRLSERGIQSLCEMRFYRNILQSSLDNQLSIYAPPQHHQDQKQETLSMQRDRFTGQYTSTLYETANTTTISASHLSSVKKSIDHTKNLCNDGHQLLDISNIATAHNINDNIINKDRELTNGISDHNRLYNIPIQSTLNIEHNSQHHEMNPPLQMYHPHVLVAEASMNWNNLRTHVMGLSNIDNASCYINAAIQCLASTPPFVDWLLGENKLVTCELSKRSGFCIICELTKIIHSICSCSKSNINKKNIHVESADAIRTHIQVLSPSFKIGEQEDASLFISSLLDNCAQCLYSHGSKNFTVSKFETIIDKIFCIKILSSIKCSSCLNIFTKDECTYMLSVEINRICVLSDALAHFVREEMMAGENAYHCSTCNDFVCAEKRLSLYKLPPIIIITLKRSNVCNGRTEKMSHRLKFDELLDFSSYTTDQHDSNKENIINASNHYCYKLYSIICHYGDSLEQGHYWSYIRTANDEWYLVDDAHYRHVPRSEVFSNSNAFVLFYAKMSAGIIKTNTKSRREASTYSIMENQA